MKAGKTAEVDRFVKSKGIKWESTGAFTLAATSVPKLYQFEDAMAIAPTLTNNSPYADRALMADGSAAVLRLKSRKDKPVDTSEADELKAQLSKNRLADARKRWIDELMKNAKIEMNPAVLSN